MNSASRIFIAGHNGMVGSAILRCLDHNSYKNIFTASSKQIDLRDSAQTKSFFQKAKPEYVFLAAARVGGIQANIDSPADFLYDNIMIQTNVIHQAWMHKVKKIIVLGSSCIYPKDCPQPMKEEYLLTGKLEPTNEGYALAKIVALKQAEYYYRQFGFKAISVMPPNLYGPNDSFDLKTSHVLSALVRRFHDAKETNTPDVTLWGTGSARREFMHVDDVAEALFFMMENYDSPDFINIGCGTDISIKELAILIAKKVGYGGEIKWDSSKPDGMLRKCMDVSRMKAAGFMPKIHLETGIENMISEYRKINKGKGNI
ncbi:MAG: GDP-L-fucose synthase [Turneriella sp.]|nr:GDP-L-fucose synthase [Turneriella sp.]